MKRGSIKTTKKQIIKWGIENIDESGYGVDSEHMHSHCWRCGHERVTERCHVVPFTLGGVDIPSNYRLLCFECHSEGPNVKDLNEMDNWIRRTNIGFYDIFWHIRECMSSAIEKTTIHFGQEISNASTNEWIHNKFLDNLVENPHLKTIKNKKDALDLLYLGGIKCLAR